MALRWTAARIRIAVSAKFPEARVSCIGGYLFLRFICPALLAPKARGILQVDLFSVFYFFQFQIA